MPKKLFWIIFVFHLFFTTEAETSHNENLIHMVVDVVKSFRQPFSVSAFFCNPFESIKLIKLLSSNGISASVHKTTMGPLPYPFPPNHAFFVLDLSCDDGFDLIMKANKLKLFSAPYKWLFLSAQERSEVIENMGRFEKIQVLLDSDVMISNLVSPEMYNISKMFKRKINSPLIFYDFGRWTKRDRFYLHENTKWGGQIRKDLNGTNLKACFVITNNDTLKHLTDRRNKLVDTLTKVNYILVQHLAEYINANLSFSYKSTWGYYNSNQSQWSGMIGELQRGEVDIGGTALFMTSNRIPVIDFVTMPTPTKSKFVFRKPKLSFVSNVYVLPFHWSVWISSLFLIIITGLVLYGTIKCEWKIIQTNPISSNLSNSWIDVLFLSLGAICQQGSSSVPNSLSGRFVTILLFMSLMFLYTSYSANIVALLQSSSNTIRTLNDLLHSRLDVGVDDTVFNHFYFSTAVEPVRRALYLQKVTPPGQPAKFLPLADGVRKMRTGYFAFHMETGVGYRIVQDTFEEHEKCNLQEIQFLQVSDPWLAVQKNTSYKEVLKIGLRKIQESGLQVREGSLMYTKKPVCANRSTSFISVSIIDCYLAAYVLLGGIIFSFILFIVEIAVAHRLKIYQSARLLKYDR